MDKKTRELIDLERSLICTLEMWESHGLVRNLIKQKKFVELSTSLKSVIGINDTDAAHDAINQYNTMINEAIAIRDKYKSAGISENIDFPFEKFLIRFDSPDT